MWGGEGFAELLFLLISGYLLQQEQVPDTENFLQQQLWQNKH
jgi:surface polysaccharide O-acyltransferase-like enzyme